MKRFRIGILSGALLAAAFTAACSRQPGTTVAGGGNTGAPTLREISQNAGNYQGQTVTVTGRPGEIIGSRVFVLRDDAVAGGGELLVISRLDWMGNLSQQEGQMSQANRHPVVQVTGTVRQMDAAAMRTESGGTVDEARLSSWANRPVILATNVTAAGQPAMQDGGTGGIGTDGTGGTGSGGTGSGGTGSGGTGSGTGSGSGGTGPGTSGAGSGRGSGSAGSGR
ncbi:MAG: hypothetical protein SFV54_05435 [Bryobacteraceae bacterium]|nr:hypothetical protein [Bryobacteraceae bacterium]